MNIQEDIDDIFFENGDFEEAIPVPEQTYSEFRGVLPDLLLEMWSKKGLGSWYNGMYRLCDPHQFDGLLSQIFHADGELSHKDCHVYAYSAFGQLHVWSERHWAFQVDLMSSTVSGAKLVDPSKGQNPDMYLSSRFILNKASLDAYDEDDKKLFSRAVKKLGRPGQGEAFGFVPALAMGGAPNLTNIKIVPALEHFLFLAQLQQFQLVDYLAQPPKVVRPVG